LKSAAPPLKATLGPAISSVVGSVPLLKSSLIAAVVSVNVIDATPLQPSVAVALPPVLAGSAVFTAQSTATFGGQVITGPVVSFTVIVCMHVAMLLQASVAL
jgi:hypothetical protein